MLTTTSVAESERESHDAYNSLQLSTYLQHVKSEIKRKIIGVLQTGNPIPTLSILWGST